MRLYYGRWPCSTDFWLLNSCYAVRILTYTTLFPNSEMPRHGIFVAERLRHLLMTGEISSTIVAPLPWFPFKDRRFESYGAFARVPDKESFEDETVLHP